MNHIHNFNSLMVVAAIKMACSANSLGMLYKVVVGSNILALHNHIHARSNCFQSHLAVQSTQKTSAMQICSEQILIICESVTSVQGK